MEREEDIPWICHVCDRTGRGASQVCAHCYKTTCRDHLRVLPMYNRESRLYEMQAVCLQCALAEGTA